MVRTEAQRVRQAEYYVRWAAANADRLRERKKRWEHENRDRIAASRAKPESQEKQRAAKRRWHDKNRDLVNKRAREARARDPNRTEKSRAYALANPDVLLRSRLKRYGLAPDLFEAMVFCQSGLCKICGLPPRGRWRRLAVDHDHVTGRVRGLLCSNCNAALGALGDSVDGLNRAIKYLSEPDKAEW